MRNVIKVAVVLAMVLSLSSCFRRVKYENPITKDTEQPDKLYSTSPSKISSAGAMKSHD